MLSKPSITSVDRRFGSEDTELPGKKSTWLMKALQATMISTFWGTTGVVFGHYD